MFDKESIIKSVNKSWPKDLIIRYLYVKLAPGFQRDLDYFLLPPNEQLALYQKGLKSKDNIHMTCLTICQYYQKLFAEFGIESKIITTNNKIIPHYALIVKGDTCYFAIDPLKDLMNNQVGLKTNYFGAMPDTCITYPEATDLDPEYIKEMDIYLKLLCCGLYTDDFFKILNESIFHRPNARILEFLDEYDKTAQLEKNIYANSNKPNDYLIAAKISIMNSSIINTGNCPGLIERNHFYKEIMKHIFTKSEKKAIKVQINNRELTLTNETNHGPITYGETYTNGVYRLERKKEPKL